MSLGANQFICLETSCKLLVFVFFWHCEFITVFISSKHSYILNIFWMILNHILWWCLILKSCYYTFQFHRYLGPKKQSCFLKLVRWKFFHHLPTHIVKCVSEYRFLISKNPRNCHKKRVLGYSRKKKNMGGWGHTFLKKTPRNFSVSCFIYPWKFHTKQRISEYIFLISKNKQAKQNKNKNTKRKRN